MRALFALIASALLLVLSAATPAGAHTRSETQSIWRILGSTVHITFTVPSLEARRLTPDKTIASDAVIAAYLSKHLNVKHGADNCERVGDVKPTAASPTFHRFELTYRCPDAKGLVFQSSAFFELVPTHVTYAQIIPESGAFVSQLFNAGQQELELESASGSVLQDASFFEYIFLGIEHIFTGYDHQAFILALVLLSPRIRDLVFVITGFTLGHSLSLSLSVLGILRPHAEFVDSLVSLTIAMVAAENMAHSAGRERTIALAFGGLLLAFVGLHYTGLLAGLPVTLLVGAGIFAVCYMMMSGHIKDAARLRLVVTLIFGTIHGFSFAASLKEMQLPANRLAELLVGFNLGVEIGQLAVVAVLLSILAGLRWLKLTLPRPIVVDVFSAALVGLGLYWFVTRGYGVGAA
jgi:hypothetical protein